ncbi:MAG TPA: ABC transporter permease subunit [Longimicrobiaceae bacterium]|nr:ABC transporter permease subunit [Longimicrobiaceae bacterium]
MTTLATSPEAVMARLTLRQILARRRALALAALCALPVLLALVSRAGETDGPGRLGTLEMLLQVFGGLIVPVVLPLVALVIGTGVFGAEIDDGTALFVLAKPVARWRIVLTRVLVAAAATAALVVPCVLLSGLVAARGWDHWGVTTGFAAGAAVGALLYCAIFVAISLVTHRALVVGLGYVVMWEGMLSGLFGGTRLLSVRHYVAAVADRFSGTPPEMFNAQISPAAALVMGTAVGVGATLYAIRRLRRFEVREAV